MRCFILDATVTQTEARFRGLAAKYLDWEVRRLGGRLTQDPAEANVILATVVSPHEWECLPRALKRIGVNPSRLQRLRQRVVLGGQGALSPAIFDPFVDVACVGEGRTFLTALVTGGIDAAMALPCAWVPGETRPVIPDPDFPWDAPPTMAEDGIVRIYASRGCQKKCLFCHTGWASVYTEGEEARLASQYDALVKAGYRINVVTNDAPALSFFGSLNVEHFSASYSQTLAILRSGDLSAFDGVRSVRFGVETPSSRLRKWIGKPIQTEALFDVSCRLLAMGIGVRWFMIAGVPGETDDDWQEVRDVVTRARHEIKKGALQISFTAFCPDSAAPLSIAPLDDGCWPRFQAFWEWFFGGPGFTRRIQLFRCAAPESRMLHAIGSMGAAESEIRRGWLDRDPPNWRIEYPYKESMRRAYNVYARRVGLQEGIQ